MAQKIIYKKLSTDQAYDVLADAIKKGVTADVDITINVTEGTLSFESPYKKFEQTSLFDCPASEATDEEEEGDQDAE